MQKTTNKQAKVIRTQLVAAVSPVEPTKSHCAPDLNMFAKAKHLIANI